MKSVFSKAGSSRGKPLHDNEDGDEDDEEDEDEEQDHKHEKPHTKATRELNLPTISSAIASSHCALCTTQRAHPMFVFMTIVKPPNELPKAEREKLLAVASIIAVSRNPIQRAKEFNTTHLKTNPPMAARGMPYWQLLMIIGPFWDVGANYFAQEWRKRSRKTQRRAVFGLALCKEFNEEHGLELQVFSDFASELYEWQQSNNSN